MNSLELKVPPLLVVLIAALLMWLISPVWAHFSMDLILKYSLSGFVLLGAVFIMLSGVYCFRVAKTTVNPLDPAQATELVVNGIYRYTRNPMYLGMLLLLLAWSIFLANYLSFAFLPLFIVYINRFQIEPEEKMLQQLFSDQFKRYRLTVRRWL